MDAGGRPAGIVIAILLGIQAAGWGAAAALSAEHPALFALCGLAYSLGMRHGLDADHIAVIDNVSRNLIGRGIRPVGLGLYFALGHSSMVTLASLATAGLAMRFSHAFGHFRDWMSAYATLIAVALLILVAPRNLMAAWRAYQDLHGNADRGHAPQQRGVGWGCLIRPLARLRINTWHMFFIGVLFGLGFETASAIAVLGMAGAQATGGGSWACILIFPLLFTAGMTFVDTLDAMFMEFAYGWAIKRPREHALYNLSVAGFSGLAALLVGGLELASLMRMPRRVGNGWSFMTLMENHFELVGAAIVAALGGIWLVALINHRRTSRGSNSRNNDLLVSPSSTQLTP